MRRTILTVAFVVSASVAQASEPVRLAQASGGADATLPAQTEQRSLRLDPVEPPKSSEAKPVEAKPAEPVEAKVTEPAKATETKSTDTRPIESAQTEPKKKPVAKKRETDEDKARRIAKKYGVTW